VNNELEGMLQKAVMAIFEVLSEYLPEATGENHEQPHLQRPFTGCKFESEASGNGLLAAK
jgi:hypothetical protein